MTGNGNPALPSLPVLVSVVIVNYNGRSLLRNCLESVFGQPYRPIEVIVVDNASNDGSVEMVRRDFPGVRLVENHVNRGFAGGNNDGCAIAEGEFIVLLNNDTVVDEGWLPGLLQTARTPEVAVVASKVVTEGIPPQFYEMNGTLSYLGYNMMRHFSDGSAIFYAGGTSMMMPRSIGKRPFLDEYFLYHEDVYFSWRARLRGMSVLMAQNSVVRHVGSATTRRSSSSIITFYQERNRILTPLLLLELRTLLLLLPLFFFDAVAKLFASLVGRRKSFAGVVRVYWWLIANNGWIRRQRREEQQGRRRSDREILMLMSADVLDGARWNHPLCRMLNRVSRAYADLVRLPYHVPDAGNVR